MGEKGVEKTKMVGLAFKFLGDLPRGTTFSIEMIDGEKWLAYRVALGYEEPPKSEQPDEYLSRLRRVIRRLRRIK